MTDRPRPRVIANFAITADGKISTRNYTQATFTSKADKRRLLEIRALGDALLVARGTVAKDNMSMGIPAEDIKQARQAAGKRRVPLRVIVTNRGDIDLTWKVFEKRVSPVIVFSSEQMDSSLRDEIREVATLHIHPGNSVDLPLLLETLLTEHGIETLVCEGGPRLLRSLLEIDCLDELYLTLAPVLFGGNKAPTITGEPDDFLPQEISMKLVEWNQHGDETYLHYVRSRP